MPPTTSSAWIHGGGTGYDVQRLASRQYVSPAQWTCVSENICLPFLWLERHWCIVVVLPQGASAAIGSRGSAPGQGSCWSKCTRRWAGRGLGTRREQRRPQWGRGAARPAAPERHRTTVMLRDLPDGFTRAALLRLLDSQGRPARPAGPRPSYIPGACAEGALGSGLWPSAAPTGSSTDILEF